MNLIYLLSKETLDILMLPLILTEAYFVFSDVGGGGMPERISLEQLNILRPIRAE